MKAKHLLILASLSGFLCVAMGAFGAHALKDLLLATNRTDSFELAVRYQFYHSIVLLFLSTQKSIGFKLPATLFVGGIVLFSGSLYFLSLSNSTALVLVTPFGGLLLLAGWLNLAWSAFKKM
jgi:uncharacterized membrane protein YgdD (TMEM256/DUF423 family)